MCCVFLLLISTPPSGGAAESDAARETLNWILGLGNRDVIYESNDFLGPTFHLAGEAEYGPSRFKLLRDLPIDRSASLVETLLERLEEPDRFVAAQIALWRLYGPPLRPMIDGGRLLEGLEIDVPTHPQEGEGNLGLQGEAVAFPYPDKQPARLRRWWDEYFRGERTVFFEAGKDRPDAPPELYDGKSWHILAAYQRFLPPRPANFGEMSIRELEAYYGAPPQVPEGFDPDAAPRDFAPPPVADWRERAGLPPADAGESAGEDGS